MNTKEILAEISIIAKDFAAEMTSVNVQAKDLQGETQITKEHVDNNAAVRQMLIQRGIVPEDLQPEEDVKNFWSSERRAKHRLSYTESRQKSTLLRWDAD